MANEPWLEWSDNEFSPVERQKVRWVLHYAPETVLAARFLRSGTFVGVLLKYVAALVTAFLAIYGAGVAAKFW